MGYNVFLAYYSRIDIPYSLPTYEETRRKFLNLGSSIKDNMLCVFFSSFVFNNERKEAKTPNTPDLMLKAKVVNSKENHVSLSMKDSKDLKCISSLALELMAMEKFKPFDITNVQQIGSRHKHRQQGLNNQLLFDK
jgi:hypothetical protein